MLTTAYQPNTLRKAENLIPDTDGNMYTRPGAIQLVDGDIGAVVPWGNFLCLERDGRIAVFDGEDVNDIAQAGRLLRGTSFQALTENAEREDRLYLTDGISPLFFVAQRSGVFVKEGVVNTVLDAKGVPYPIDVAEDVTTWRGRLWLATGGNRAQHCDYDAPHTFDPLFTVEAQGEDADKIINLTPANELLLLGLRKSVWAVSGDSQYNFQTSSMLPETGCAGAHAIVADATSNFIVSDRGVYAIGSSDALSQDIEEWFEGDTEQAFLRYDKKLQLLYVLIHGRLFVINTVTRKCGEITGVEAIGLFEWQGRIGWFGSDGAWLMMGLDEPDKKLDGSIVDVVSVMQTWADVPNKGGNGRAAYQRGIFFINGSPRCSATYTLDVDEDTPQAKQHVNSFALSDVSVDTWSGTISNGMGQVHRVPPVRREVSPQVAGSTFRHTLQASCYMKLFSFEPVYQFGAS